MKNIRLSEFDDDADDIFRINSINWIQEIVKIKKNYDSLRAHLRLQPATLLKLTLLHGCFLRFLNCTNGTKSLNASQGS